nr:retrovirus-related Pol polyprotein from transposon TNT 1-94 [Tanacetum cinerariifolium]
MNSRSVSYLQDAQPESTRKTLAFSEAVLNHKDKRLKNRQDSLKADKSNLLSREVNLSRRGYKASSVSGIELGKCICSILRINNDKDKEQQVVSKPQDGLFLPKTAEGDAKPESQWTPDERRVVVQDQRLKSIIIFKGPLDTKENKIIDLKLEYQNFRAKSTESLSHTYTRYKTLLNELANDGANLSKHEIIVSFVNSIPEKWLTFSQGLRNANHTQTLDLADIYGSQTNLKFPKDYKAEYKKMKAKLALFEASPSSPHNPKTFQPKNKGDDELTVKKNHAPNGEWVDMTMRKVNTLISMDEDADWQNYLKREDHRTSNHEMYIASLKRSKNYKAQPYQYASSSKQILKAKAKPFPPCTYCGFNYYRPDDCKNYPECEICGSYDHFTSRHNRVIHIRGGVLDESSQSNESSIGEISRESIPDISYFHVFGCLVFIHKHKDHLKETYHVTFDESMEAIRFTNTLVNEIGIDDSSRYLLDEFQEDDPSRQYQVDSDVSYYIIPYERSLTEITQESHVPEVIAHNKPKIPHTKDTVGPSDLINTEGIHEQNVQNDQMITQPTDASSGNNTEGLGPITEPLVPDVTQSHISNQAFTSSHPAPQDRWSRHQHIKLVNIIGNPSEGMLTRSMAAKLTAALASECLFSDFLSKIEPIKVSESLKYLVWIDAMQEELN